jgi:hypothetical protein
MGCIGTGMRFFPTDKNSLKHGNYSSDLNFLRDDAKERTLQLDMREQEWRDKVSVCPSLYEFLEKKYSE